MIVLKEIRASRLQVAAMNQVIEVEAQAVSKDILLDFELTTWSWQHPVKFQRTVAMQPDGILIEVVTDDKVYGYVDNGTRPHIIRPKNASTLHFMGTFKAKTSPGTMVATAGASGPPDVFAQVVHHPGTKARNFSKKIAKEWEKKLSKRVDKAIQRAVKVSGHAM